MQAEIFKQKLIQKIRQNNGKITIIADKDGVLCLPHGKIEPLNEIMDIVKAGVIFVIISGANIDRAEKETIEPLMEHTKDSIENRKYLKDIPLIMNNGASIYLFDTEIDKYKCVYKADIKKNVGEQSIAKVLDILRETRDKFPEIMEIKNRYPEIKQINNEETQIVFRILGKIKHDELRKTYDPHGEKRKTWAEYIKKRFDEQGIELNISVDGTSSINILLPGINKGSGIDQLAKILNIPKSALMYLGDNFHEKHNDRIAVENRIDLAVNFGRDVKDNIEGVTLINSAEKGPPSAKVYLKMIHDLL
ncbi:HAD hydrolase family protein [Thermoproteota archaeon]